MPFIISFILLLIRENIRQLRTWFDLGLGLREDGVVSAARLVLILRYLVTDE
jgi:hypothetical protein